MSDAATATVGRVARPRRFTFCGVDASNTGATVIAINPDKLNAFVVSAFYASEFPASRGALLSYTQDNVLPVFYGITTSKFTQGLGELEAQQFDPTTTLKYFNEAGSGHELWFAPSLTTNGVTVQQFVTQMTTDDLNWVSQKP